MEERKTLRKILGQKKRDERWEKIKGRTLLEHKDSLGRTGIHKTKIAGHVIMMVMDKMTKRIWEDEMNDKNQADCRVQKGLTEMVTMEANEK